MFGAGETCSINDRNVSSGIYMIYPKILSQHSELFHEIIKIKDRDL